jgi:xylulokinase
VAEGDTYGCIGTTAWISSTLGQPLIDAGRRIFSITALDGEHCGVFGTVQAAGRSVEWAMELLGEANFENFDALLESVAPGSEGLVFLPYLEGERSPIFDPLARGVLFGLTPGHGRAHVLRSVVEGVCYGLRSVLDAMRETIDISVLRLIGGGGQSPVWQQMLADICDVPVHILSTQAADATSLGAAVAAGVGVGLFSSMADGVKSIGVVAERQPDGSRSAHYKELYDLYVDLYPRLKPAFPQLHRLGEGGRNI